MKNLKLVQHRKEILEIIEDFDGQGYFPEEILGIIFDKSLNKSWELKKEELDKSQVYVLGLIHAYFHLKITN